MTGTPEGSTESGEAGNRTCDPWFTRHSAYPLHHWGIPIDMGLLNNFPFCCGQLVKILITLNLIVYLDQILHTNLFQYCPSTLVCKILAGQYLLVNMLVALEPHGIF